MDVAHEQGLCDLYPAKVEQVLPLTIRLSDGRLYARDTGYECHEVATDARVIWGTPVEWERAKLRERVVRAVGGRPASVAVLSRVLELLEGGVERAAGAAEGE